jgi:hypothetical protein
MGRKGANKQKPKKEKAPQVHGHVSGERKGESLPELVTEKVKASPSSKGSKKH